MTNTPKEREEFEAALEFALQAEAVLTGKLLMSHPEDLNAAINKRDSAKARVIELFARSRPAATTEEHKDWCIGGEKGPCNCKEPPSAPVSAMRAEPVAWRYRHIFPSGRPSEIWVYTGDAKLARRFKKLGDFEVEPLYTHPPAVQAGDAFAPGMPTPWTQQLYEAVQRDFKRGQNCKDDEPVINVDRLLDLIAEISSAPTEPPKPEGVKCRNPACCLCGSLVSPPQPAPKERQ